MDIRPVKKRRRTPESQTRHNVIQPIRKKAVKSNLRNKLTLKATHIKKTDVNNKQKTKVSRIISKIKNNRLTIGSVLFLAAMYLPASKFINSIEQYRLLISQSYPADIILNNSGFMPQKWAIFLAHTLGISSILLLKITVFIFSLLAVYLFYRASQEWFGKNIAILITLLFSSSSWMILHSQSLVFDNVYLFFIPLIIFLHSQFSRENNNIKIFLATMLLSVVLYSPGMVWAVLGLIVLIPFFMHKIIVKYPMKSIWMSLILIVVSVLPLLVVSIMRPSNFARLLTGKSTLPTDLQVLAENLQRSLDALFVSGVHDSSMWLIGTPIFNLIISLLFAFGLIYLFINKKLNQHLNFLIIGLVFSTLTLSFVGLSAVALVLPIVYLTAGFGIKLLLANWYSIFPNNPVARNLGLSLVIFITILAASYDIARYYIAWPKAGNNIVTTVTEKNT